MRVRVNVRVMVRVRVNVRVRVRVRVNVRVMVRVRVNVRVRVVGTTIRSYGNKPNKLRCPDPKPRL